MNNPSGLVIWLLFFVAMIFLLFVLPARQRRRHMEQVESALRPGVEVMTTSGLFAKVLSVEGDVVVLEVAPGVANRYAKQAIARVVAGEPPADPETAAEDGREDKTGDETEDRTRDETEEKAQDEAEDTDTKDKPSE